MDARFQLRRSIGLLALLGGMALGGGCERATPSAAPTAATAPAKSAWETCGDAMVAKVKPGMTQDEVLNVLGQPNEQLTFLQGGEAVVRWRYDITNGIFVRAVFNANGKLLVAKVASAHEPQ